MAAPAALELRLLPGARRLLAAHARELPQRDDLCGAFCGALALSAAAIEPPTEEPLDQDAVALRAGSTVAPARAAGVLPDGEQGRRDYRLELPTIADADLSGTTTAGLIEALQELSGGALDVIALSGPWTQATLGGLFDAGIACEGAVTLIANLATHHLWGAGASIAQLLDYLQDGVAEGPPADWKVGHFACLVGRVRGPGGTLYGVADTYPSLGHRGLHMQPAERLAAAIERHDMPAGGILAVAFQEDGARLRSAAAALGLEQRVWENGTVAAGGVP